MCTCVSSDDLPSAYLLSKWQMKNEGCPSTSKLYQRITETSKGATCYIQLALSNLANSQTEWQAESFRYHLYLLF